MVQRAAILPPSGARRANGRCSELTPGPWHRSVLCRGHGLENGAYLLRPQPLVLDLEAFVHHHLQPGTAGLLGRFPALQAMPLLLAAGLKLKKFGA